MSLISGVSGVKPRDVCSETRGYSLQPVTVIAAAAIAPSSAGAWAPAATATVHPGVQTFTEGGQCTANFIYTAGGNTYIGQAAHCASTGAATDTDGCLAASQPLGTAGRGRPARRRPGTLAYSSWLTMQANGESDPDTCAYNDLALVKLDPADVGKVNPSVPGFGGPVGVGGPSATGDDVYSYGNSSLRFGITQLSPKQGIVVTTEGNGWSRTVYTVTPGIPGDSGQRVPERVGPGDRHAVAPSRWPRWPARTGSAT